VEKWINESSRKEKHAWRAPQEESFVIAATIYLGSSQNRSLYVDIIWNTKWGRSRENRR